MGLQEYKKKRNFRSTPEPPPEIKSTTSGNRYVIQKHDASRLHYDLRLELDGVLKSWAIPKGPSLDPAEKRLAVEVEDHPFEYGDFEGVIPEGQYGGGTVMLWDKGEWQPLGDGLEDYRKGHLKFNLKGKKLHGRWVLVRMPRKDDGGKNNWLLIKERDEHASPDKDKTLLKDKARSVVTNRTMEEIARDKEKVWHSDRTERGNGNTRSRKKTIARSKQSVVVLEPSTLTGAKKEEQPERMPPMLATYVREVPTGDDWIHEIKYDGYRIISVIRDGEVRLYTRNANDWTGTFPSIARAMKEVPARNAIFDGELVALRTNGVSDFQALQNSLKGRSKAELVYYVFDVPWYEHYNLTRVPLIDRKLFLQNVLRARKNHNSTVRFSDHVRGEGKKVWEGACQFDIEGVISKAAHSAYEQRRSRSWLKIKCKQRQEFVVGGYTDPEGARTAFGALVLGYYQNGSLVYAGRVGTGFNEISLNEILRELKKHAIGKTPFTIPPKGRDAKGVHWVKPLLVAEVEFGGWTAEGILRHPSFQGLRPDKKPTDVIREIPQSAESTSGNGKKQAATPRSARGLKSASPAQAFTIEGITLSNPDRVLYPEQGITKLQLAQYYSDIKDWILPFIRHRPLSLVRCPLGYDKHCFYQKHFKDQMPAFLRGVPIVEKNGEDIYIVLDDASGLIAIVQLGVLEIHPWGSRENNIEKPDCMVFDLDPAPDVNWNDVIDGARTLKQKLEKLGLRSFVKTTGGKGLHVYVPLTPRAEWDEVKAFARAVAEAMATADPGKYLTNMSKARRQGRIFVDYLRNGRGATAVAAYSTRARSGAPVSTPLAWDELSEKITSHYFTVENIRQRLSHMKEDPWAEYFKIKQMITAAARRDIIKQMITAGARRDIGMK